MAVNVRLHELQVREGRLKASWPGVRKCFKRGVDSSTWEMSPSSCITSCVASSLPWGNIAVVLVQTPSLATRYIRCNNYYDPNIPAVNLRARASPCPRGAHHTRERLTPEAFFWSSTQYRKINTHLDQVHACYRCTIEGDRWQAGSKWILFLL